MIRMEEEELRRIRFKDEADGYHPGHRTYARERSERVKRPKRHGRYDSDSGSGAESDADFVDEKRSRVYGFQLARPGETEATEDEGSSDEFIVTPRVGEVGARWARTVSDVCESGYVGSGESGGLHGAKVTVVEGGQGKAKPLFRWM